VEKVDGQIFAIWLGNDKAEFRGLGHEHHGLPQLPGAVEQDSAFGGGVQKQTGGNAVERNKHAGGSYAAYWTGHTFVFGQGDGDAFTIGQFFPMQLSGADRGRKKQGQNDQTENPGRPGGKCRRHKKALAKIVHVLKAVSALYHVKRSFRWYRAPVYSIFLFFSFSINVVRLMPRISAA
jgi:hypothetical protein